MMEPHRLPRSTLLHESEDHQRGNRDRDKTIDDDKEERGAEKNDYGPQYDFTDEL